MSFLKPSSLSSFHTPVSACGTSVISTGKSSIKFLISLAIAVIVLQAPFAVKAEARHGATYGTTDAEAVFELGIADTGGLGYSVLQEYRISDNDKFKDGSKVKIFTWAAKKPKSIPLRSDRKIFVFARINRIYGAGGITDSGFNSCLNGSSFTPVPNGRYRVIQTGSPYGSCELRVVDLANGAPPADIEQVEFHSAEEAK